MDNCDPTLLWDPMEYERILALSRILPGPAAGVLESLEEEEDADRSPDRLGLVLMLGCSEDECLLLRP